MIRSLSATIFSTSRTVAAGSTGPEYRRSPSSKECIMEVIIQRAIVAAILVAGLALGATAQENPKPITRAQRVDDVLVAVAKAWVGTVRFKPPFETSSEAYVQLAVLIQNTSKTRRVTFTGWGHNVGNAIDRRYAELKDELGNEYLIIGNVLDQIDGQAAGAGGIYPGEKRVELLVFERPVKAATSLILKLPRASLSAAGEDLQFTIPNPLLATSNAAVMPPDGKPRVRVEERSLAELTSGEKASPAKAEIRAWVSVDSKFSTDATFIGIESGSVRLRKRDGAEVSVPLHRLSPLDRAWVKDRLGR